MRLKAIVKEILLDKYLLELKKEKLEVIATIRGNAKKKSKILVGDIVEVSLLSGIYIIEKVLERKNFLIRPPVSNIDNLVIVISLTNPSPDYFLLDKQLVLAMSKKIRPILVINKIDLNITKKTKESVKYIKEVYGKFNSNIIEVSAKENIGISKLKFTLKNSVSAFSGNSGVGKSSIVNNIFNNLDVKKADVGKIAKKTSKGKHTTKHVRIYEEQNMYILDTPGFSSYELYDIDYKELKKYYPEFLKYKCNFADCNHVNEDISVCKVKQAVKDNQIDDLRYYRYSELFNKLKEIDDRKYK